MRPRCRCRRRQVGNSCAGEQLGPDPTLGAGIVSSALKYFGSDVVSTDDGMLYVLDEGSNPPNLIGIVAATSTVAWVAPLPAGIASWENTLAVVHWPPNIQVIVHATDGSSSLFWGFNSSGGQLWNLAAAQAMVGVTDFGSTVNLLAIGAVDGWVGALLLREMLQPKPHCCWCEGAIHCAGSCFLRAVIRACSCSDGASMPPLLLLRHPLLLQFAVFAFALSHPTPAAKLIFTAALAPMLSAACAALFGTWSTSAGPRRFITCFRRPGAAWRRRRRTGSTWWVRATRYCAMCGIVVYYCAFS